LDRQEAREVKAFNRTFKDRERARRDARMLSLVRAGRPPYSPSVMSWISRQLDKPARKVTPADIKSLLS
jgi:hypothetical protein